MGAAAFEEVGLGACQGELIRVRGVNVLGRWDEDWGEEDG